MMNDNQTPDMAGDQFAGDQQGQGGYCIEIYVAPGGQGISVSVESDDDEGTEGQGEQQEPSGADVQDINAALQLAHRIYKNGGQMDGAGQDANASAAPSEHDDLMAGYGSGGVAARRGMPVNRVLRED